MQRPIKKDANYLLTLVEYVKKNLGKGYTLESLKWALISQGHSKLEVDKAIKQAQSELAKQAPILKPSPEVQQPQVHVEPEPQPSFWKRLFG